MTLWLIAAPTIVSGFAAFTAYSAVHPRAQVFGAALSETRNPKHLALTFDDGPNPVLTPKLLDLLDQFHARATFFLIGKYVRQTPSLAKEIAARGHVIGNHTDSHPNLFFCGPQETRLELACCTEAIQQATTVRPRWFRPPFGFRSPWVGEIVHQQGMRMVMWSLLPGDWRGKSTEWLIERTKPVADRAAKRGGVSNVSGRNSTGGDVLCLHDGDYARAAADRTRTLAALEYWLPRWRDAGLEFVTIGEAVGKAVEV
jgi:peptidoglycan-N-acetylglucosamine deacetylase